MLQYILHCYQASIRHFEHNIDLRISLCYVLNDLALYKNEALTAAEYCSTLDWSLSQGIAICQLLSYLEEEDVSPEQGSDLQSFASSTSRLNERITKNLTQKVSAAFVAASSGIDVKTYAKRVKIRRKKFYDQLISCFGKQDDL